MSGRNATEIANTIDIEAARWTVRLSAGSLGRVEQAKLDHWLAADPRHVGALARARAAWLDLDRLAALAGGAEENASLSKPDVATTEVERPSDPRPASRSRRWFLAAGVAATALSGAGTMDWLLKRRGQIYVTDMGEVRRVALPDGSSMLLNTATRAIVRFSGTLREVELLRGEGLFEVAKDASRPFVVRAQGVAVRAVGTVFAVRVVTENVDVTVTEGAVEVADATVPGMTPAERVAAHHQAVVTPAKGIEVQPVTEAQVERRLAWREGMLIFDGELLSEAVEEINRHNARKITIDDPALAQRPVVGIFRASDEAGFARTVAAALSADSTESEDTIHLRTRR
jgi:transmembrane sensor